MPSRVNHVKLTTPEPAVVEAFLREVCDLPEGWPLGTLERLAPDAPLGPGGTLDASVIGTHASAGMQGFIVGDTASRQFQILESGSADAWAVAISTRHLEAARDRAVARGVPCTPIAVLEQWGAGHALSYFFCEVGGLLFELLRVED